MKNNNAFFLRKKKYINFVQFFLIDLKKKLFCSFYINHFKSTWKKYFLNIMRLKKPEKGNTVQSNKQQKKQKQQKAHLHTHTYDTPSRFSMRLN